MKKNNNFIATINTIHRYYLSIIKLKILQHHLKANFVLGERILIKLIIALKKILLIFIILSLLTTRTKHNCNKKNKNLSNDSI